MRDLDRDRAHHFTPSVYNPWNEPTPQGSAMCGIVGFLDKRGGMDRPLGQTLLALLEALSCRGPDSAGGALFGTVPDWQLHVSVPPDIERDDVLRVLNDLGVATYRHYGNGVYLATIKRLLGLQADL